MYWFYILKGFHEVAKGVFDTYNIENDVFIASSREEAKTILINKYGSIPFRKPKKHNITTKYLYLIPSDEYWYDYHHGELTITCECCGKEVTVIGRKNLIKNKIGEYCSNTCKEQREQELQDKSDWINENDHVGLGNKNKEELVGYIYKITNKHTLKCYVGQTVNVPIFRWWQHLKIDKKFGQADISELLFEVLEVVTYNSRVDTIYIDGKDKLNKREGHYIQLFNCVEEGYNSVQPKEFEPDLFNYVHLD